jgi:hypothetical protein
VNTAFGKLTAEAQRTQRKAAENFKLAHDLAFGTVHSFTRSRKIDRYSIHGPVAFAVGFRHGSRYLPDMVQIVHDPGRQQLSQRHFAQLGMEASPIKVRSIKFIPLSVATFSVRKSSKGLEQLGHKV